MSAFDNFIKLFGESREDKLQGLLGGGVNQQQAWPSQQERPVDQARMFGGMLDAGYSNQEASSMMGLLSGQEAQEQTTMMQNVRASLPKGATPVQVQEAMQRKLYPEQGGGLLGNKDRFSMSQDLAKQRTAALKPYMAQRSQAQKTITSLEQGTGAGDLAAVISFNKSLDPSSVVREGEQAATTGAAGPIERLRGLLSEVEGEGALSDTSRRQMASLIREIQLNEAAYANNIVQDFNQRAESFTLNPMDIRGGQLGYGSAGKARDKFEAITLPTHLIPLPPGAKEL